MDEKTNKKQQAGDKRISIKITGHGYITAFENKEKTQSNQPDFKGDGVAVWLYEKTETKSDDPTIIEQKVQ